jgi:hypothetical protein
MHASFHRHALRVVQAAYRVADDIEGWIAGVLEPAKPLLDRGSGLQAHAYQVTRAQGFAVVSRHVETEGTPVGFSQAMLDTESRMPTAFVPTIFCSAPAIVTMTQMSATVPLLDHPEYRPHETMSEYGLQDMLAVVAHDPSGIAVVLCAPSERPLQRVEDRELEGWCMLRAHLLAGLRLQHVPSTISSHLRSAMHRVGARDIASVAAILRGAEEAS